MFMDFKNSLSTFLSYLPGSLDNKELSRNWNTLCRIISLPLFQIILHNPDIFLPLSNIRMKWQNTAHSKAISKRQKYFCLPHILTMISAFRNSQLYHNEIQKLSLRWSFGMVLKYLGKKKRAKINRNFNLECFVKVTEQPASKRELIHTVSAIGH